MSPSTPADRPGRRLAIAAAALAGALVAANALGNGFAFDDTVVIEKNDYLHAPARWAEGIARPYWPASGALWRPVAQAVFAVLWWLGGGQPIAFHLAALLAHATAAGLVALVALRWMPPIAAATAGLVFALHPIHVEAVANGVGLAELTCTIGLLLVAWRAQQPDPAATPTSRWLLAACAALAVGAKEIGVAAPAIAWAAARLAAGRAASWRAAWWAGVGVLPLLLGRVLVLGTVTGDEPHVAWVGLAPLDATLLALRTLAVGAGWLLFPRPSAFEHSPPLWVVQHPEPWLVLLGVALLALVGWAVRRQWRGGSPASLAVLWWAATLLPVSNLVFRSGVVLADRNLYAPSVSVAWLAGLVVAETWALAPTMVAIVVGAVLAWSGACAWRDMPVWHDTERVVDAFVARAPTSWVGWLYRGQSRLWHGRRDEAKADFDRGLAVFDREARLLYERAVLALRDGDTTRAIAWLDQAVTVRPKANRARQVLLDVLAKKGLGARADKVLRDGLRVAPDQRRWRAALERRTTATTPFP